MTSSAGLLDYYILEASDYLDRLETLLGASPPAAPESDRFILAARGLRGSSTMANLPSIVALAGTIERAGHATRDGLLAWGAPLHTAMTAAVEELRTLVPQVRGWTAEHDRRAAAHTAVIAAFLPDAASRARPASAAAPSTAFFASEADGLAASLEAHLDGAGGALALGDAIARARALRGIAALADHPALGEVAAAVERTGSPEAATPAGAALLAAAARVLRRAAGELRATGQVDPTAREVEEFAASVAALTDGEPGDAHIVPIESLFYADEGPHIISRPERPPTTADERFRVEMLTHAEHLRRLVADAREALDLIARDRAARELRLALHQLRSTAESFGAMAVAAFCAGAAHEHDILGAISLDALDAAADALTTQRSISELGRCLAALSRGRALDLQIGRGFEPIRRTPARTTPVSSPAAPPTPRSATPVPPRAVTPRAVTPVATPVASHMAPVVASTGPAAADVRRAPATPTGRELQQLLRDGIAGLRPLDEAPLSEPASLDDAIVVPIEALLYRGRSALTRAIELRDEIRSRGAPNEEELSELFDLLDLAAVE